MSDALLVLNAGSSSLKFSVFLNDDPPRLLLHGQLEGLLTQPRFIARNDTAVVGEKEWPSGTQLGHHGAIEFLFTWGREGAVGEHRIVAVGHRVVHGGVKFTAPVLVDASILAELEALVPLAPLHQPHNVAAIKAVAKMAPVVPQVACFDTAFHRTQPKVAEAFALPRRFIEEGVRRYGFHGLSYEYIASVLPALDRRAAEGRAVVAHLGNGASMCAMSNGRSIATTMSFTALDGLMMGTRCGAIDPGVLLYLIDRHGMNVRSLTAASLRTIRVARSFRHLQRHARAARECRLPRVEALDLFVYRINRELGSLAAALGGLDALVFTGGIGENAAPIRARVCRARVGSVWTSTR